MSTSQVLDDTMKNSGIYKITNILNNKVYIGSAISIKDRFRKHLSALRNNKHINKKLQNSYNKHGELYFKFEIIEYVESTDNKEDFKNILLGREQYYLDLYESYKTGKGYNVCINAGNRLGMCHSEETKNKIKYKRKFQSKMIRSEQWKFLISEVNKGNTYSLGKKRSEETKKKMSDARKGMKPSEETRRKWSAIRKGKKQSSESIEKRVSKLKGRKPSEETKNKIKNSLTGRKRNRESVIKSAEAHKKSVINITTGKIFDSIKEAAFYYDIKCPSHIGNVCRGKAKTAKGFVWRYL